MYSKKLLERFRNPKHMGKLHNPDGVGKAGNPACGDHMWMYIKVKDGKIVAAKFETLGCPPAISCSDVLCELAVGKTIEEATKISNKDIVDELGGIPAYKWHCSVLGMQTLRKAIENYKKRAKR